MHGGLSKTSRRSSRPDSYCIGIVPLGTYVRYLKNPLADDQALVAAYHSLMQDTTLLRKAMRMCIECLKTLSFLRSGLQLFGSCTVNLVYPVFGSKGVVAV